MVQVAISNLFLIYFLYNVFIILYLLFIIKDFILKQINTHLKIPKGQLEMDNPERKWQHWAHKTKQNKTNTRHNMCFCFVSLCLVYPILPVSLDFPFLIDSSVFSNVYVFLMLVTHTSSP